MFRFLKKLFGVDETHGLGLPSWSFSDAESIGEAYGPPDRVDYALDLSRCRYQVKATFRNDSPYAESETSIASMDHEVRRSAPGQWEVRLLGRNGFLLDQPEAWEAAPARFLSAWEQAWAERQEGGSVRSIS